MNAQSIPKLTDLHIRLVSKCNLDCKHCYASDWFVRNDVLDTALVRRAIDEAIGMGLERVTLTGGEPLLHKDVPELLLFCVERGMPVKLETNGLLIRRNDDRIRNIAIQHKELICIYISYDLGEQRGLSDEAHQALRGVVLDLWKHGVDVRVQSAITEINADKLESMLDLSREYGITQRFFFDPSPLGNGLSLAPFTLDWILETHRYLKSLNLDLELELPPLITGDVEKTCGWGVRRCELMANGDVTTCAPITFTHTGFVAGNLRDRSLSEIWSDSEYFVGMREIEQSDFQGVCGKCTYWESCRGSCRAYAWSRGRNWFSPYPLCQSYAERYPDLVKGHLYDDDISVPGTEADIERLPRVKSLATSRTDRS